MPITTIPGFQIKYLLVFQYFLEIFSIFPINYYFTGMIRLLGLLILFPLLATGQMPTKENRYLDSLQKVAQNKSLGDSSRAQANYFISGFFSKTDIKQARWYLKEANKLAKAYPFLLAGEPFYEATFLPDDDERGLILYKKADSLLSKFTTDEAYLFRSKIWLNYASVLQLNDKQTEAVNTIISKSIPLTKKGKGDILLYFMYADLATLLSNIGQNKQSKSYFSMAIEGLKKAKSKSSRVAAVYIDASSTLCLLKEYKEAAAMLDEAHKRLVPFPESPINSHFYAAESMYLNRTSNYKKALISADKGLALATELHTEYINHALLLEKLESFRKLNNYRAAEKVFKELQKDETFQLLSNVRRNAYKTIAEVYAADKQFPNAYFWMEQYSRLNDSISESNIKKEIYEMEVRFRNQENLHNISMLKSQKAKAEYSAENNRLMSWLLAAAVLFFLLLLFLVLLNYQKSRRLAQQEKISYKQQLKELAQQEQLQVSSAVIEGEERERKRMARDLHDGLGGLLAGVRLHLSALFQKSGSPSLETKTAIIGQVDSSLNELRRIAKNMMPETLIKFGLERAILDLCMSCSTPDLKIEFQSFGIQEDLPEKTQIMIYRIIQEILANAIRHASASTIMLQCSQNENIFLITAEDDGKGFDTNHVIPTAGMGLENIKARVEYLNGKLDLDSAPNEGTIINIELDVCKTS